MSPGSLEGQLSGGGVTAVVPLGTGTKLSIVTILALLGFQTCETNVTMVLIVPVLYIVEEKSYPVDSWPKHLKFPCGRRLAQPHSWARNISVDRGQEARS